MTVPRQVRTKELVRTLQKGMALPAGTVLNVIRTGEDGLGVFYICRLPGGGDQEWSLYASVVEEIQEKPGEKRLELDPEEEERWMQIYCALLSRTDVKYKDRFTLEALGKTADEVIGLLRRRRPRKKFNVEQAKSRIRNLVIDLPLYQRQTLYRNMAVFVGAEEGEMPFAAGMKDGKLVDPEGIPTGEFANALVEEAFAVLDAKEGAD